MIFTAALNRVKEFKERADGVNAFMALGMDKDAAKILSNQIVKACKQSGATKDDHKTVLIIVQQALGRGHVDEMGIRQMSERCPAIVQAMMTHFGYTHRNLIRHAGKQKISSMRMVQAIMRRI